LSTKKILVHHNVMQQQQSNFYKS